MDNATNKKYYYAHAGGSPQGPFSEQELRELLSQGRINENTNVIEKGQQQWSLIKHVLKDHELPKRSAAFVPSATPAPFSPGQVERHEGGRGAAYGGAAQSMDRAVEGINDLNVFIDKLLYKLFGYGKLAPYFKKWVNISVNLTSMLTILASVLVAFAIASIVSTPKAMYASPYSSFNPRAMDAVQKAAEADSGMSGGTIMVALIGGFLLGVVLQYISGLFSRANVNYFYGRKPVLSSMLWPRLNVIGLIIFVVGTIISLFALKGVGIFLAILVLASLLYMIWLHLNCDRIFMEVTEKDASGPSDFIGYVMYQLRFTLVAVQTLTPVWLLGLSIMCCATIFSDDKGGIIVSLLPTKLSIWGIIGGITLLTMPVVLHLCYIFLSLWPELLLSVLQGWKKS